MTIMSKLFRRFSKSFTTEAIYIKENTKENTAPPVKASGQNLSLTKTAVARNVTEKSHRQVKKLTFLKCLLLRTE